MTVSAGAGLLSVEAARDAVLDATVRLDAELVAVADALGRVVAETVTARVSLPPWPNSAMDGYAIRAADTGPATEAAPVRLEVIGDVRAGVAPETALRPGTAVRIATGARLPAGADAVIPVEATTPVDGAGRRGPRGREATGPLPAACLVHQAVPVGGSVRDEGSDLRAGDALLAAGAAIGAAGVALLAGAGVELVRVHRRPRVAVLATGDEVRAPGEPLGPAGIPDANGPGLRAQAAAAGAEAIDLGIASDELDDVLARLRRGLEAGADALIVSGGVSVGPYDVVKAAMEAIGRVDLWRVAVQPGKPFAFGTAPRPAGDGDVLVFGLPGNPVSSAVTFELFVRPAIRRLAGRRRPAPAIRPRGARRTGEQGPRPARLPAGDLPARRCRRPDPRRAWPRPGPACGRAGEPRHLRPRRRRRAGDHPRSRRFPAGGRRGRPLVARPALTTEDRMDRMDDKPAPRAERRRLSHVDRAGRPRMVDISDKAVTARRAVAEATVAVSPETMSLVIDGGGAKGDVLSVAELAGVMGAKRTSELIPLCHPLALTDLVVAITPDRAAGVLRIRAEAATTGQTGVEMEAMTAASVAALTVYDMVKGVERGVEIRGDPPGLEDRRQERDVGPHARAGRRSAGSTAAGRCASPVGWGRSGRAARERHAPAIGARHHRQRRCGGRRPRGRVRRPRRRATRRRSGSRSSAGSCPTTGPRSRVP